MITTDFRSAAGLAAAADLVERSAVAREAPRLLPPPAPSHLAETAPARLLAFARQPPRTRRARSARRPATGYAVAKASAANASIAAKKASGASKAAKPPAKPSASDPLAFLKDPKLTIEEKLMKLLGYMDERWEKEMQAKMDQIAASERAKKAGASKSSKSGGGGILGSVAGGFVDFVQKAVTGDVAGAVGAVAKLPSLPDVVGSLVSELGGPALAAGAAALGFPELAPALVKLGPELGKLAKGWLSDASGAGGAGKRAATTPGSSSGKSSSSGGKVLSDSEQQVLVMDIQRIQQQQKEMFALVSNVLKGNHDARMSVLNNLR